MYNNKPIDEYLKELASRSPVPGGGSAAALVGATGAALLSKVANFTIGKEKYKAVESEMKDILKRTEEFRESFIQLCSEDAKAYKKLSDAFKLPKTDMEKRQNKIQEALKEAIAVPLEICKRTHSAIKLCLPVAEKGNVNLITDVGIVNIMFSSAFQSALLNIDINLKSIKDNAFILETKKALEPLKAEVSSINEKVKKIVEKNITK